MFIAARQRQLITTHQQRPFYKTLYNMLNKNKASQATYVAPNQPEDSEPQLNVRDARERYIQTQTREMFISMKADEIPKGVIFSQAIMSAPLFAMTGYLCLLAPMAANPALVDPV